MTVATSLRTFATLVQFTLIIIKNLRTLGAANAIKFACLAES